MAYRSYGGSRLPVGPVAPQGRGSEVQSPVMALVQAYVVWGARGVSAGASACKQVQE